MLSSFQISAALVAGVVALITAAITAIITVVVAERKLRRENKLEFAAERVAKQLLLSDSWEWRRFDTIRHFLGGFEDDELRRILVRAGAVRAVNEDGDELWGLLSRNPDVGEPRVLSRGLSCHEHFDDIFLASTKRSKLPAFMKKSPDRVR